MQLPLHGLNDAGWIGQDELQEWFDQPELGVNAAGYDNRRSLMFGSRKRQSTADAAVAVLDEAIQLAAERWQFFCDKLVFRENVGLADRIAAFMVPFEEGVAKTFPVLRGAPDGVILMIVAKGVERSGSHSRAEIEQALGLPLPDYQRPDR